jgi:alpha-beta hydrolase superfamily lysophospholipase
VTIVLCTYTVYNESMKLSRWLFTLVLPALLSAAEAVKVDTGTGALSGTIELPASKPPYAIVLIVAGSGPTDRDGNNPLLPGRNDSLKMIADHLAARGIASLRYDKRAIGQSKSAGMKEEDLRFETYVDDAVRWGEYLRKDPRFRALVIAGHSEGSLIGMIAAQKLRANGFISIAGAGLPGGQLILKQFRSPGIPPDQMKSVENIVKSLEEGRKPESVPAGLFALFHPSVQPYLISWFKYDPAREIANLKMPVLILQGTTDIQVSVDDAKLLAAGDPAAKLVLIDGMNHVLKEAPTDRKKNIASYSDPSLPVVPKVLDEMVALIDGLKLK